MSPTALRWTSASCSHVGLVRQVNEDACLALPEQGLWAVADGMGGHARGDVASRLVIDHLNRLEGLGCLRERLAAAQRLLASANRQLLAEAALRRTRIIGSTVVVLLAVESQGACLWAGDSRLYLLRQGRLQQLTRDHSQLEKFREQAQGALGGSVTPPARNLITRAVGAGAELDLEESHFIIQDGDTFLLCSDGLSNELSEGEIGDALLAGHCRQAAENLVDRALHRGGHDNVTAVVVRAEDPDSTDRTMLNPAL